LGKILDRINKIYRIGGRADCEERGDGIGRGFAVVEAAHAEEILDRRNKIYRIRGRADSEERGGGVGRGFAVVEAAHAEEILDRRNMRNRREGISKFPNFSRLPNDGRRDGNYGIIGIFWGRF
jgi:hypothetical protein